MPDNCCDNCITIAIVRGILSDGDRSSSSMLIWDSACDWFVISKELSCLVLTCCAISSALISSISSSIWGVLRSLFRASLASCSRPEHKLWKLKFQILIKFHKIKILLSCNYLQMHFSKPTFGYKEISRRLGAYWQQYELQDGGENCNPEQIRPSVISPQQIVDTQHLAWNRIEAY